jgi:hypothetical protein
MDSQLQQLRALKVVLAAESDDDDLVPPTRGT